MNPSSSHTDLPNTISYVSVKTLETRKIPMSIVCLGKCRSADEYEKVKLCGEGSYGVVWKGVERKTGKEFALKKLRLRHDNEISISAIREIHSLRSVQHENIVRLEEIVVGSKLHKIFLVIEFCDADLASMLNNMNIPFTESQVKCLLLQLFEGLEYIHRCFFVHRDIKLSNLLLNSDGILKIGDFGLAKIFGLPPTAMTTQVVTLWYRAPELLLVSDYHDTGIDIWSSGLTDFLFPIDYHQSYFTEAIENEYTLGAFWGTAVIGFVMVKIHPLDSEEIGVKELENKHGNRLAYIALFAVQPNWQNRGIGSELINRLFDEMKNRMFNAVYLHASATNFRVIEFYQKRGFQKFQIVKDYYVSSMGPHVNSDAWLMIAELRAEK